MFALLDRLHSAVHVISLDHTVRVFANFRSIGVHVVLYTNAAAAAQTLRNQIRRYKVKLVVKCGEIQIFFLHAIRESTQ